MLNWVDTAFGFDSNIIGIMALLVSAIMFWLGYKRKKESEQISIMQLVHDNISKKYDLYEDIVSSIYDLSNKPTNKKQSQSQTDDEIERMKTKLTPIEDDIKHNLNYFGFLIAQKHVVSREIIEFFGEKMSSIFINIFLLSRRDDPLSGMLNYIPYFRQYIIEYTRDDDYFIYAKSKEGIITRMWLGVGNQTKSNVLTDKKYIPEPIDKIYSSDLRVNYLSEIDDSTIKKFDKLWDLHNSTTYKINKKDRIINFLNKHKGEKFHTFFEGRLAAKKYHTQNFDIDER